MARPSRMSTPESKKFADQLDELVKEKKNAGITQAAICEATGIAQSSMSAWINDEASPTLEAINKLADYFDVSSDYLLGRSPARSPNPDAQAAQLYTGLSAMSIFTLHTLSDSHEMTFVKRFLDDFLDLSQISLDWYRITKAAQALSIASNAKDGEYDIVSDIKNISAIVAGNGSGFQISPIDAADYYRSLAIANISKTIDNIVSQIIDELHSVYQYNSEAKGNVPPENIALITSDDTDLPFGF